MRRAAVRDALRDFLGITNLVHQVRHLRTKLGDHMATEAEQLNAISAKLDDLKSDVQALVATLSAERDNLGPAGQQALDDLSAKLDTWDAEVGDADGSDNPPPVQPNP